ncbi:MAG: hypothetical protein EOP58_00575 [Sphingomonadales bacterium]|nr:MAG: hypothetical protein EOP58_00575 [Sphingomonadales bacterium]
MSDAQPLTGEIGVTTTTTGVQAYSSITILAGGGRVVTWESTDGAGRGIFARRYDAGGAAVGSEFRVNALTTGEQTAASIAALADGGFAIVWRSNNIDGSYLQPPMFRGQRFDADGNAQGGEFGLPTPPAWDGIVGYPSVAARSGGGFVVTWDYYVYQEVGGLDVGLTGHVYGQLYGTDGAAVGGAFEVSNYVQPDLNQRKSSLTGLSDGGFVVAWSVADGFVSTSHDEVYARRYDAAGVAIDEQMRVNRALSDYYFTDSTSIAGLEEAPMWSPGRPIR